MKDDFTKMPESCVIDGDEFVLASESRWVRRYSSKAGVFFILSKLVDGSFDESLKATVEIDELTPREKREALLAIKTSGRKDLPEKWLQRLAEAEIV